MPVRYFIAIVTFAFILQSLAIVTIITFPGLNVWDSVDDKSNYLIYENSQFGLNCLWDTSGAPKIESRLSALNCLTIDTPNVFWETNADELRDCIEQSTMKDHDEHPCESLGYGNWECSFIPLEGPLPACLKHYVAYSTLQLLDGHAGFHKLDDFWNPRNKHLADMILRNDMERLSPDHNWLYYWMRRNIMNPLIYWFTSRANNKTWPVTYHDTRDINDFPYFRECAVPEVEHVSVVGYGRTVHAKWNYNPGCLERISVDYYRICWKIELPAYLYAVYPIMLFDSCRIAEGDSSEAILIVPSTIWSWQSVILESIEVRPNDIEYGGPLGSTDFLGGKFFDPLLQGAYYPKQRFRLTARN